MKILIAGKGGTGKTTIAALLSYIFSDEGFNVLAIDTDSVPNLALSLGIPLEVSRNIIPLVKNDKLVEEKTGAKPGEGWGLLFSLTPDVRDIIYNYSLKVRDNLRLLVVGSIDSSKEGCLCPAIALARALLRHLLLSEKEVVIVDSEAGAEVFGRGLAEKFEYMLCICEPTIKSIDICSKLCKMGEQLGIRNIVVVINKTQDFNLANKLYKKMGLSYPYHIVRFDDNIVRIELEEKGVNELPQNSPALIDVRNLYKRFFSYIKKVR